VTKPKDPNRALQTIDRAATRIAVFAGGTAPRRTTIGSVEVREIALGRVSLYYGVRDDELIASTATAPFRESSGPRLADDPVFSDAADAVDLPDDAAAFVYVNIRDSLPVVDGFARAAGEPFPADATANIEPLTSFLGFSTIDGDLAKFSSLLQVS